jgi:hypothetical protein
MGLHSHAPVNIKLDNVTRSVSLCGCMDRHFPQCCSWLSHYMRPFECHTMPRENQDVLAPYVYFSVGLASAMGSRRVGCSVYSINLFSNVFDFRCRQWSGVLYIIGVAFGDTSPYPSVPYICFRIAVSDRMKVFFAINQWRIQCCCCRCRRRFFFGSCEVFCATVRLSYPPRTCGITLKISLLYSTVLY